MTTYLCPPPYPSDLPSRNPLENWIASDADHQVTVSLTVIFVHHHSDRGGVRDDGGGVCEGGDGERVSRSPSDDEGSGVETCPYVDPCPA